MSDRLHPLQSRLFLIPVALLVFGAALGAGFAWGGPDRVSVIRVYGGEGAPDGSPPGDLAGFVIDRDGDALIVRSGDQPATIGFAPDAVIELMHPISSEEVAVGDWIVVGGRDDNVNSYIVEGIVVIPAGRALIGGDVADAISAAAERREP